MSRIGSTNATNRTHEWLTEILQAANSGNSTIEGATAAFAAADITVRTRLTNVTQILRKPFSVSYTEEAMEPAGVMDSEFAHQRELKTKELARDMNAALINQISAVGTSAIARTMHGLLAAITTNTTDFSGTPGTVLGQTNFNQLLQNIWLQGGRPNATYVHGFNKRQISNWATPSMPRAIEATGKKIVTAVDIYDSDFGRLQVLLEREMPVAQVAVLQEQYWKKAFLRPFFFEELGKSG